MVNNVKKNKLITAANFKDFDWNKAKLFYHIAKCGSFTKAARLAGIDQSVLSRQIQILEKQVGCPLLIRKAGGIFLTRKGEELLENVAPFFLKIRGFCGNAYREIGEEKKRKIRIMTTYALAAYILNELIITYNKDNPHLIFEVIGEDHAIDVIVNDIDIAIRPYDSQAIGVQQELLFTLQKKLYASTKYLKMYGEPRTVDELKDHFFITNSSKAEDYPYADIHWILKLGLPDGKKHEPIFLSNSLECMLHAAKEGVGIIGGYEVMSILKNSNLINILPDVKDKETKIYCVYPDYLKEDAEIIAVKNYLMKNLKFNS